MTVSGNLGAGWRDCQRLVTKHLPADRIAISPGNVVTGRKKKERQRGAERGGGGSRDRDRKERLGEGGQMESERWEDKEERWCVRGWWETAAMESER